MAVVLEGFGGSQSATPDRLAIGPLGATWAVRPWLVLDTAYGWTYTGTPGQTRQLSPFSLETKAIRARDIEMFGKAIGGARQKTHPDLAGHMPGLLWLYQMGLILYWTCDGSQDQHRTRILFEKSLSVVVTLMRFSGSPPLKPARRLIRELLEAASFDASSPDG
jgi:hypothetical protein